MSPRMIKEKIKLWFVWKMPDWLVYWCSIRLIAHATQGPYGSTNATELTAMDALDRWNDES